MEADGTYTPDDVHKLLAYSDDFDVVCGTRTASLLIRAGAEMSFFTRYPNVLYAKAIEVLFNTANLTVNRREIVTPDRRQILTPYSRCLKRQESFPVSMISQ